MYIIQLILFLQVTECESVSTRIFEMISVDGESDQTTCLSDFMPIEFFEDMESSWKGRVKRIHLEDEFSEVERAARALSLAVSHRFSVYAQSVCRLL